MIMSLHFDATWIYELTTHPS